jgi:hypothetical protein
MKKLCVPIICGVFLVGCTHTQVTVRDTTDDRLTCTEIASQAAEVRMVLRDIDDKTGMSGRNVAMGLFFWPGIIVNQMNAGDARKAASERLAVLADLSSKKSCG